MADRKWINKARPIRLATLMVMNGHFLVVMTLAGANAGTQRRTYRHVSYQSIIPDYYEWDFGTRRLGEWREKSWIGLNSDWRTAWFFHVLPVA